MRAAKFLVALLVMLSLSACITPRSYVDPQYRKATFASIGKTEKPMHRDARQAIRTHLKVNHSFNDTAAEYCLEACLNLHEALRMSSKEAELTRFEKKRAAEVARWAADGAAGA